MGPKTKTGMNCKRVSMTTMAISVKANVGVSTFRLPALSGTCRLTARRAAISKGIISAGKRPASSAILQLIFHQTVLSASPSNPEPLLAKAETYS